MNQRNQLNPWRYLPLAICCLLTLITAAAASASLPAADKPDSPPAQSPPTLRSYIDPHEVLLFPSSLSLATSEGLREPQDALIEPQASGTPDATGTPTRTPTPASTATHTATSTITRTPTQTPTPCVPGWTVITAPSPGQVNNYVAEIAVVSPNDIWAVGIYGTGDTSTITRTLILRWNGTLWSQVSSPNPGSIMNELWDIDAISAGDIWAVGMYTNVGGVDQTLIVHWNGSSWSVVPSPNIGPSWNWLHSVSAVSANDVWAVGESYATGGQNPRTLIQHWNGSSWQVLTSPNPGASGNWLRGVAAISANDAWAVGFYRNGSVTQSLTLHWNGTAWSTVSSPNPSSSWTSLVGIVAISSNNVWATGTHISSNREQTLVLRWNGSSWSIVPSPSPGSTYNYLRRIIALSANDIWAVGRSDNGAVQTTLAEHWDGSSWSIVPALNPGTSFSWFLALDAVSPTEIWAVGTYGIGSVRRSLIERYKGCGGPIGTPGTPIVATPTATPTPGIYCVAAAGGATGSPCSNPSAYTSVQAAINAATNNSEIRIASGAYYGTGSAVGVVSKPITITGGYAGGTAGWATPGPAINTLIDGQGTRNGFEVQASSDVTINNLRISNGGITTGASIVKVAYGALHLISGGTSAGRFNVAAGAELDFSGGPHTLDADTSITGPGAVNVNGGTFGDLQINGPVSAERLTLVSGKISGAGPLSVTNVLSWTGGAMTGAGVTYLPPSAQANIYYSTGFITLDTRTINNHGTARWSSPAQFYFYNGGTINNHGTFEVAATLGMGGQGTINNHGTFRKAASVSNVDINNNAIAFNNYGNINVPNGMLTFAGNSTQPFTMLSGTQITGAGFLRVGAHFSALMNIAGPTTAQNLQLAGGTITGTSTLTVTGVLSWTGGNMAGSGLTYIPPAAQLDIAFSTASIVLDGRTINNTGTTNWKNSAQFYIRNGGTFNNNSLFDIQNNIGPGDVGGTINNYGLMRKQPNATLNSGGGGPTLNNYGTLELNGSSMNYVNFANTGGTILFNGVSMFANYPLNLQNGTLKGAGTVNGAGTINSGIVSPGTSPGVITTSTYTQYVTGTLNIELGGLAPGTQHDQVKVTGAATLGGTLNVSLINGYAPNVGDAFTIMTYGSRTGSFSNVNTGCTGRTWSTTYNANNIILTVTGVSGPVCTPTPTPSPTSTRTPTPPGATATPTPCIGFSDVPIGSTFHPYITCLVNLGIVSGYADCTFRPNANVTRGQLSKIVSLAANFTDPPGAQIFEDVLPGSTFYDYAQRLANRAIIGGYACGGSGEPCIAPTNRPYFRPNANATRGQISKIVANAANFTDPPGSQTFEDVAPGSTFFDFVQRLASRGVMSGYACGGASEPCVPPTNRPYFRPNNNATRGQVSKIVANTFFPNCQPQAGK